MKKIGCLLLVCLCLLFSACTDPEQEAKETAYRQAQMLLEEKSYDQAETAFAALGTYRDSQYKLSEIEMARKYDAAVALLEEKDYAGAYEALGALGEYQDVPQLLERFQVVELNAENWETYYEIVEEIKLDPFCLSEEGFYKQIPLYHFVALREGVSEKFYAPQRNTMTASIHAMEKSQEFYLDTQTGEYYFTDTDEWVYQNQKTYPVELHEDQMKEEFIADMIFSETDGSGHHLYYGASPWSDFCVLDAEGRLYLYIEE